MAPPSSFSNIRNLAQLAHKTQAICLEVCGVGADITVEVKRLYVVLSRLQQEASSSGSGLTRQGASCMEDLVLQMRKCKKSLDNCHDFLSAYRTMSNIEKERQLSLWTASTPLSRQQLALIDLISDECVQHASRLADVLVTASADSIGPVKDRLAIAGDPLRLAATSITARLIARNDLRSSATITPPKIGLSLWDIVHDELLSNGFSTQFLALHRNDVLAYVTALGDRSIFDSNDVQDITMDEAPKDHSSNQNNGEGRNETYPSRKRTRPDVSDNPLPTYGSKTGVFDTSRNTPVGSGYRATDPHLVYKKFMEDNPFLDDEECLDSFLAEKSDTNSQSSLRDQIRHTCFGLRKEYEPRVNALLAQDLMLAEDHNKEYRYLHFSIEKNVIDRLDQLGLGPHEDLRSLRKKIINKAERTLTDLEAAKNGNH